MKMSKRQYSQKGRIRLLLLSALAFCLAMIAVPEHHSDDESSVSFASTAPNSLQNAGPRRDAEVARAQSAVAKLLSERFWQPEKSHRNWLFQPKPAPKQQAYQMPKPITAYAVNPYFDPIKKGQPLFNSMQPYALPEGAQLQVTIPNLPAKYAEASLAEQLNYQNLVVRAKLDRLMQRQLISEELAQLILERDGRRMVLAQVNPPPQDWKKGIKHYKESAEPFEVFVEAKQLLDRYDSVDMGPGIDNDIQDSEGDFDGKLIPLPEEAAGIPPDTIRQSPSSSQAGRCQDCDRGSQSGESRIEALQNVAQDLLRRTRGSSEVPNRAEVNSGHGTSTEEAAVANSGSGSQDWKTRYENTPEVLRTLEYAVGAAGRTWQGYCYRKIKQALLAGGLVTGGYWSSQAARNGATDLLDRGFVNLVNGPWNGDGVSLPQITDVRDAPEGAVLVYEGGNNTTCGGQLCGHIEIKSGPGYTAVSEVIHDNPMNPERYRLVGVMVKPEFLCN